MSHSGKKRKRPSTTGESLQERVSNIFNKVERQILENRLRQQQTEDIPLQPVDFKSSIHLRHSSLCTLFERLKCISKQSGSSNLETLQKSFYQLTHSTSDFVSLISLSMEEDDIESTPPLCVITKLLRDRHLHIFSLHYTFYIERAAYEISHPSECTCEGPTHAGVHALIDFLLDGVRSSRCDVLLRQLITVFFYDTDSPAAQVNVVSRFQLANIVIKCLYKEWTRHGEQINMISQWVHQAVTPSRFLDQPIRDKSHVVWTPELSGLAAGCNVNEYLQVGATEKEALVSLFQAIPAEEASRIYRQCVSDLLKLDNSEEELRDPIIGTWSRVILLGNRITDKNTYEDVDENLRRSIISSITGTLCSSTCYNDGRSVAVILCLTRRLFISQDELTDENRSQVLERYHDWFRNLVNKNDALVVKALLNPLTQLLPLESIHFLKLNHRVFTMDKSHFRVASEFVSMTRARIRDIDPAFARIGALEDEQSTESRGKSTNGNPQSKVINEVINYISGYVKGKGNLPPALIRNMNFHRYHFRRVTVPVLLHPDLVVLQPEDSQVKLTMSPESFDEHRIELINELAFKRKDQAITKAEAKEAVKSIMKANKQREKDKKGGKRKNVHKLASLNVQESSDLNAVMYAILKDEAEHGFNATQVCQDGTLVQKAKDVLCSNVVKLVSKCNGNEDQLAFVSLNILESLCSSIESVEQEKGDKFSSSKFTSSTIKDHNLSQKYSYWWGTTGRSLVWLISQVFGDSRIVDVLTHVQFQLFSLICLRNHSLPERKLLALAMIVAVLIVLQGRKALSDLCFMITQTEPICLRHVAFVIFDCLPVKAGYIMASTLFVVEIVLLLKSFTSCDLLGLDSDPNNIVLGTVDLERQEENIDQFVQPFIRMLRWVVSMPWRLDNVATRSIHVFLSSRSIFYKVAIALQELGIASSKEALLTDSLALELRCGHGKKEAIVTLFRGLETSGMSPLNIIQVTLVALASEATMGKGRKSDWVLFGLLDFHDECNLDGHESGGSTATSQMEECSSKFGSKMTLRLLEYYHFLEFDYFRGCEDIEHHLRKVFINFLWPLPKRLVLYIVTCLRRTLSYKDDIVPNPFFIANCAYFPNIQNSENQPGKTLNGSATNGRKQSGAESLDKKISQVSTALQYFTGYGSQSSPVDDGYGSSYTQKNVGQHIESITLEHAFALGVALGIYFGKTNHSPKNESIENNVRQIASTISMKIGHVTCCDILDCALIACSLLPFSCVENENEGRDGCAARTDVVLTNLIVERMRLCQGDQNLSPFWTKEILTDNWQTKAGHADIRQVLSSWDPSLGNCSIARLLSLFGRIDDSSLSSFVKSIRLEAILQKVLPNMVWAYSKVRNVEGIFGDNLTENIINGVGRLSVFLEVVNSDIIASLSSRFGNVGAEVSCLLKSRGYG